MSDAQTSTPPAETAASTTPPPAGGGTGSAPAPEPQETKSEQPAEQQAPAGRLGSLEDKEPEQDSDEAAPKDDKAKAEQSKPEGDLEVKLPEGSQIDEKLLGEFKSIAQERGLDSETASALATWYVETQAKQQEFYDQQLTEQETSWEAEIQADKTYGGDNVEASDRAARRALRKHGGQEFVDSVVKMGLQNWPPLWRFCAAVGLADSEDTSSTRSGGTQSNLKQLTREEKLRRDYPSMFDENGRPSWERLN